MIDKAAHWLRGPLRPTTLNEAIRALNGATPKDGPILEMAWGVNSLETLQRAVRDLCHVVAFPEYAAFMDRRLTEGAMPSPPWKRQPPGGLR